MTYSKKMVSSNFFFFFFFFFFLILILHFLRYSRNQTIPLLTFDVALDGQQPLGRDYFLGSDLKVRLRYGSSSCCYAVSSRLEERKISELGLDVLNIRLCSYRTRSCQIGRFTYF